jgi:hypothetical protein
MNFFEMIGYAVIFGGLGGLVVFIVQALIK